MSYLKITSVITLIILFVVATSVFADWKDGSKAMKVSAASNDHDYSFVLTQNKSAFGAGDNYFYQLGLGNTQASQLTFIRVHDSNNNIGLKDINDIAAGWTHSLFRDVNNITLAVGNNDYGQLRDYSITPRTTPVRVHGPNNVGYLKHIIAISAGRSGKIS